MKDFNVRISEVLILLIYIVSSYYFIKAKVKDEMASINKRLSELELYVRATNAMTEHNRRIVDSLFQSTVTIRPLNKKEVDNKDD